MRNTRRIDETRLVIQGEKVIDLPLKDSAVALARIPTAPYHEHQARAEALRQLAKLPHLTCRLDPYGNVIAHYKHRPRRDQALALVAHLDHPGFVIPDAAFRRARCAEFLGGVSAAYFQPQRVLFFNRRSPEPLGACVLKRADWTQPRKRVYFDHAFPKGAEFGMWDLPVARFTADRFINRDCDDLVGAATIITLLRELAENEVRGELYGLLTRAEEVGFHGALGLVKSSAALPRRVPVLSLETSNARGFAKIGAGPILRVGDRTSVFTPSVTAWMHTELEALKKNDATLVYQRLLMGGGTCEATVFQQAGYPAGALCVALKNYHNMGPRDRIAAEAVSLADWQGMYRLLRHLVTEAPAYELPTKPKLMPRLAAMQQEAVAKLKASR